MHTHMHTHTHTCQYHGGLLFWPLHRPARQAECWCKGFLRGVRPRWSSSHAEWGAEQYYIHGCHSSWGIYVHNVWYVHAFDIVEWCAKHIMCMSVILVELCVYICGYVCMYIRYIHVRMITCQHMHTCIHEPILFCSGVQSDTTFMFIILFQLCM